MDIYKLYRNFWDYAFNNPEKIKPNHVAIYSFAIEHCNRLGWKQKFGFPTSMVLEATGIKSYSVYKKTFDDLVEYGFINVIEYSKNQYSSNIIALKENNKANDKALNKALTKHMSKHLQSTRQSTDSIDKQIYNNTNIQVYRAFAHLSLSLDDFIKLEKEYDKSTIDRVLDSIENFKDNRKYKSLYLTAKNWISKELKKKSIIASDGWDVEFQLGDVMPNGATLTADVISHHLGTGLSYKKLAGL